jgi:hypothetical protein
MNTNKRIALLALIAIGIAGCGPSAGSGSPPASTGPSPTIPASSSSPAAIDYHPTIDPAQFSDVITNPYFPLTPGTTYIFEGTRDGQPMRAEVVVTTETKMIMGVRCVVVRDTVTSRGALVEGTTDWYAQAATGDVWYFGEDTKEYENGLVVSTHGSWEAGVDSAQPGIIMEGDPQVGDTYRQEYRPGEAEDTAEVLRFDPSIDVPAGTYQQVLVTEDTNPLDPDRHDTKIYAPGAGLVYTHRVRTGHEEEMSLVETHTN